MAEEGDADEGLTSNTTGSTQSHTLSKDDASKAKTDYDQGSRTVLNGLQVSLLGEGKEMKGQNSLHTDNALQVLN